MTDSIDFMNRKPSTPFPSWLEDAIIYEIYPQSFYDSNADGIGDVPGIIAKLDYLRSLGITACWLNPCFESPFLDAGYDVSDYCKVAARYGTNADLKRLINEARRRGIRILLDLVPGHTSIEHPWFKAACKYERNEYSDYYIFTDSAWKWDVPGYRIVNGFSERDASYLTNFFYFQPALNYGFAHPDPAQPWQQPVDAPGPTKVRQEIKNIMRFWLETGVSGFRVDMAMSLVKGDIGCHETIRLWQEIRAWLDKEFPDACLLSEWGVPSQSIQAGFHLDFCLPFGMPGYTSLLRKPYGPGPGTDPYGFSFFDSLGNGNIMEFLDDYIKHYRNIQGKGFMALPSGNHDINPRLSKGRSVDDLELVFLFLLTMPGVPVIYYGDEIGMRTLDGLPSKEGGYNRTGSRTPMQWADTTNAGFSTALPEKLYLPVDPSIDRPTVAQQLDDPDSLLQRVQKIMAIRKSHSSLQASGNFEVIYAQPGTYPLIFRRDNNMEAFLIAINPSSRPVETQLSPIAASLPETIYGIDGVFTKENNNWKIKLPGISGGIYRIT
jgi:glycosidase